MRHPDDDAVLVRFSEAAFLADMPLDRLRSAVRRSSPLIACASRAPGERRLFLPSEVLVAATLHALCSKGLSLTEAHHTIAPHLSDLTSLNFVDGRLDLKTSRGQVLKFKPLSLWADIVFKYRLLAISLSRRRAYLARKIALDRYASLREDDAG